MNQKYFLFPFATAGDLNEIPNPTQGSGVVSYQQGFGSLYSENPLTIGTALEIDRASFNAILYDMTTVLQNYQQNGTPEFITSANNGGTAYSYRIGSIVRYSGSGNAPFTTFISLTDNNTATPVEGANWSQIASFNKVAAETTRATASENNLQSQITTEVARATAAESLLAPKANPAFTGNGSITGTFNATEFVAQEFATTGTGSAVIGTGGLGVTGYATIYGALTADSTLTVAGTASFNSSVSITSSLSVGSGITVTGNISGSGTIYAPGNISNTWNSFTSGGIYTSQALNVTGTGSISGGLYVVGTGSTGYTLYVNGNAYHAGNAVFASTVEVSGLLTAYAGLNVGGAALNATDGLNVNGALQITGNTTAEWVCNAYGAGNPAMQCSVGIVASTYGFNATGGYYIGAAGVAAYGSFSGQFSFSSGEGNLQGLAFYATSDVRLKENFAPITPEDGRKFIKSVKPTAFDWKADGSHGTGYVAQQLWAAGYEHLITVLPNDKLEAHKYVDGNVTIYSNAGEQQIAKYDDMQAYYHAAILDCYNLIDKQAARIEALEARLG